MSFDSVALNNLDTLTIKKIILRKQDKRRQKKKNNASNDVIKIEIKMDDKKRIPKEEKNFNKVM